MRNRQFEDVSQYAEELRAVNAVDANESTKKVLRFVARAAVVAHAEGAQGLPFDLCHILGRAADTLLPDLSAEYGR